MWLIKNKKLRLAMGVLETINLLFIRLAIKNRRNCRRFPGRVFREYMSLVEKDQWISKDIFSLVNIPRGTRITLEHLTGEGIDVWLDELAYLALITKTSRPRNVFEIGTYRGRTALSFALNSPDDCTIWTLDLPPNQRERFDDKVIAADLSVIKTSSPGAEYKGKDVEPKIRQLYGNSLTFDFSPYFGNMDIVFIDGAHHYEAVKSDTANALKMVKPNGLIIWHDFAVYGDYNDVTRAVLDTLPGEQVVQIANSLLAVYRHL